MEAKALVPELLVEDMGRAIDFYTRLLGFRLSMSGPESETPMFAELTNGPARLVLLARDFVLAQIPKMPAPVAQGGSIVQIPVASPEAARNLYSSLQSAVSMLLPLRDVGNGWVEFAFCDPDGNMIVVLGQ